MIVVRDAGSVLAHAHNRGLNLFPLSVHIGLGRTCCWHDPVANDQSGHAPMLLDHLVGDGEQPGRHLDTKPLAPFAG
jgi:hypothetical protein